MLSPLLMTSEICSNAEIGQQDSMLAKSFKQVEEKLLVKEEECTLTSRLTVDSTEMVFFGNLRRQLSADSKDLKEELFNYNAAGITWRLYYRQCQGKLQKRLHEKES